MGSLSPKTRNAQVELYQSGDVDFLVATDAIGMGINMDLENVYFSNLKKFDGKKLRRLNMSENMKPLLPRMCPSKGLTRYLIMCTPVFSVQEELRPMPMFLPLTE